MNILNRVVSIRDRAKLQGMRIQKRLDARTIKQIHKQYAQDIAQVRHDERLRYEALLSERNEEIARLHEEVNMQRRHFQDVRELGIKLNDNIEEVTDLFRRGFEDIGRGLQKVEKARSISNEADRQVRKIAPIVLKAIK